MTSNRLRRPFGFLATTLAVAACDPGTNPIPPLTELPRTLTVAEQRVISHSNEFAFDLLRTVNAEQPDENVFLSPLSVSMALGMTMNGAAGTTFDEMATTLGFDSMSQEEINAAYRGLLDLLSTLDRTTDLGIANSVWYRNDFPFHQTFLETVRAGFDAEVEGLNFNDPAAVARINGWVSNATSRRIEEIVQTISPNDVMFLINAVYFKGAWVTRFEQSRTLPAPFRRLDGSTLQVNMMSTDGTFRYRSTADYEAVELPYGNSAFVMTVVVPSRESDVNRYLEELDQSGWDQLVAGMATQRLIVSLPRFRMEYEKGLNESLQALGMRTAFAAGGADFTKMSPAGRDLYISSVKHKTFVDVNEEGTEAAAVTKVTVSVTSAPPAIRVDRPFLFAIRERFSGAILFTGKIVEPTEG